MAHNLRDRCSEYLAGPFLASVGASVQLGGAIQRPFVGQTYKTAYGTSTGDMVNTLPINIDQGVNWQSGYAKFDHDTNSLEIQSISASSSGGVAVAFTAAATVSIVMLADIPFASAFKFRPTGVNDHLLIAEAGADLAAEGGGKLVLMQGDWDTRGNMPMIPGVHIAGEGKGLTKLILPTNASPIILFDYNSTTTGDTADQHHWGLSHLTIDGENAANTSQAIVTKSGTYAMKNVTLESVVVTGFGKDDDTVVTDDVMAFRDPEGLVIHNSEFRGFGNRTGVRVRNNDATAAIGASIFTNKFVGIKGTSLAFDTVDHCRATFNEFDTPDTTSRGFVVHDSDYNNIALNQFAKGLGTALVIKGTSAGNQLLGNVGISDGETGTTGIEIESTCANTSVLAGSFTGYADDLDDSSTTTYIASLATTGGVIVHKPEPEPFPDPVVVPPIPPFLVDGLTAGTPTTGDTDLIHAVDADTVRITVMLEEFGTTGSSDLLLRLKHTAEVESGYETMVTFFEGGVAPTVENVTIGFPLYGPGRWSSGAIGEIVMTLTRRDTTANVWMCEGTFMAGSDKAGQVTGVLDLGASALTEIIVTTAGGTETTTSGNFSVLEE